MLERLQQALRDERWTAVVDLQLAAAGDRTVLSCDLLMDTAWQGGLKKRWFG
ncbi:MAG: hypothetical protein ACK4R2_13510 [Roseateles sp.]